MATQTYTINETDIYKRVDNIGSTTYINIADGTSQKVPWGTMDYFNIIWGNLIGAAIVGGLLFIGAKAIFKF